MHNVIIGSGSDARIPVELLDSMFQLRDKVFNRKLGWDVQSSDGKEKDNYDELNPTYMMAVQNDTRVEACWRILPTVDEYMLRNTFPCLLRGEVAPQDEKIWELSRFAVCADSDNSGYLDNGFSNLSFSMIRNVYEFAVANGIEQYVTVTSVALERMMKKAGIPLSRFGDGKATKMGKILSVACWVPINEAFRDAVYATRNI